MLIFNRPYTKNISRRLEKPIRWRQFVWLFALLMATSRVATGADYGQFGPFDYYDPPKGGLSLVERAHMGPVIADQLRQQRWCDYWGSLDYALRAFPNHPEALVLMAKFLEEHPACPKAERSSSSKSSLDLAAQIEEGAWQERKGDYYFQKGVDFRPKRPATRVLYGKYLYQHQRLDEALSQFKEAEKLQPTSAETHYYLGMIYFDKKDTQKAKLHAEKAYHTDQSPPELRDRLVKAGVWKAK